MNRGLDDLRYSSNRNKTNPLGNEPDDFERKYNRIKMDSNVVFSRFSTLNQNKNNDSELRMNQIKYEAINERKYSEDQLLVARNIIKDDNLKRLSKMALITNPRLKQESLITKYDPGKLLTNIQRSEINNTNRPGILIRSDDATKSNNNIQVGSKRNYGDCMGNDVDPITGLYKMDVTGCNNCNRKNYGTIFIY